MNKLILPIIVSLLVLTQIAAAVPYDRPGSALLFSLFTSSTDMSQTNTKISVTNTNPSANVTVRCTLVYRDSGEQCKYRGKDIMLLPNQTTSFYTGTLLPGKSGYAICAAINQDESLMEFNYLYGQSWIRQANEASGLYSPIVYYATFSGSVTNENKLKIGTDYTPGAPSLLYTTALFSPLYASQLIFLGATINPAAIWPATDIINASQSSAKNDLIIVPINSATSSITVNTLGDCFAGYPLNDTLDPYMSTLIAQGDTGWLYLRRDPAAASNASFGNPAGGLFTTYPSTCSDPNCLFKGLHETFSSINTVGAFLPFHVAMCGNGMIEGNESCDSSEVGGATCGTYGFTNGTLTCAFGCDAFNTSGCYNYTPPTPSAPTGGGELTPSQQLLGNMNPTELLPVLVIPAEPGTYIVPPSGAVIPLEGPTISGNEPSPDGSAYIVVEPGSPVIVKKVEKIDPTTLGPLPNRTILLNAWNIEITAKNAFFCRNFADVTNIEPSNVTVYSFNGSWKELPSDRITFDSQRKITCGHITSTPYMIAGFATALALRTTAVPECPSCPLPGEYGPCINNSQSRLGYDCSASTNYACQQMVESRYCIPPGKLPLVETVVVTAILMFVAFIFWRLMRRNDLK